MNIIESILTFLGKPKEETKGKSPEGTCPVCWGYQEYDSKIRKLLKDKQIDVNNGSDHFMKVQKFMVKYVDGIRLKQGIIEQCPTCGKQTEPIKDPTSDGSGLHK